MKPGFWFNYRLMREFGNTRWIAALKGALLTCGKRVFIYK